jgi:hypothetical protein
METNPYSYDRTQPRTQQQQLYQNNPVVQNGQQSIQPQQQKVSQRSAGQKSGTPAKMPKARAMALANAFKRTLAVVSILSFGMFGGLVAMHQVSTTSTSSTTTQSTSGSSNTSTTSSSSSQNSNTFFKQQGGNSSGTNSTSSSSTSSTPVTGTTTS